MNYNFNRELGQFEQQLENLSTNQQDLKQDLYRFFERVEADAKSTISEIGKTRGEINKEIIQRQELEKRVGEIKKIADDNKDNLNKLELKRSNFETEIRTGTRMAKTLGWVATVLAAVLGGIASLLAIMK